MRIFLALALATVACGPKHAAGPAPDFTLHDKLVVRTGSEADALAYQMLDPDDGALTPIYEQRDADDTLWDAVWAGRCVVYAHGQGMVDVFDPVSEKRWTLDEGRGGVAIAASEDGTRVAWDCVADAGPAICVTLVDNTEDRVELVISADGGPIFPLAWRGDEVIYGNGHALYAIDRGTPRELAKIESEAVVVAPGGATFMYPDGDAFAVHTTATGEPARRIEPGEPAQYGNCVYAGPDHLACWGGATGGAVPQIRELATGATKVLADPVDGDWMLGAPNGDGAAYTVGPTGQVWVARGGEAPRQISDGVYALDDWRP